MSQVSFDEKKLRVSQQVVVVSIVAFDVRSRFDGFDDESVP